MRALGVKDEGLATILGSLDANFFRCFKLVSVLPVDLVGKAKHKGLIFHCKH